MVKNVYNDVNNVLDDVEIKEKFYV